MSALPSLDRADRAVVGADAAEALYAQYRSRIFAFCLSRLGNREEAEDATQTTFLNAFRSLHGGLVPRFELAWLFRIADNVCRDGRKSAWRRGRVETTRDLQELQDVVTAPERRSDGLVGLDSALAAMPERQRRAILLREWQGLSYDEIAAKLGLSKAAVETLLFRARRSLARELEAPQAPPRRARAGFDVGWLLGLFKSLFSGAGAAKVAASVAVVAGAGVVVATPLRARGADASPPRADAAVPALTKTAPRASRTARVVHARAVVSDRRERPAVRAVQRSAPPSTPRSTTRSTAPSAKGSAPTRGGSAPERPTPQPPASTGGTPAPEAPGPAPAPAPAAPPPPVTPPASLPSLPPAPALPPVVPETPPVEPPAVPPLPDLPVDVPDVPKLP
jgi:RNA polymerase sigma factor (sigma-70 family)